MSVRAVADPRLPASPLPAFGGLRMSTGPFQGFQEGVDLQLAVDLPDGGTHGVERDAEVGGGSLVAAAYFEKRQDREFPFGEGWVACASTLAARVSQNVEPGS